MQTGFQVARAGFTGQVAEPVLNPPRSRPPRVRESGIVEPAAGPAESCQKAAGRKSKAKGRAVAKASPLESAVPHGTPRGYQRHRCRCAECRTAEVVRLRDYRARVRQGKVRHRPNSVSCVPVSVRGVVYPSIAMAAAALGVTPASITTQLRNNGSCDRAGLGRGTHDRHVQSNAKPCVIHGRAFPSIAAAGRYLGVSLTHLYREMKTGVSPSYSQFLLVKLMRADARRAAA